MKRVVIMQPYYLAWYGFFEQIKLADCYVFYDDVQYVKRSLMSRVDIKTAQGSKWLSVPLRKVRQRDVINAVFCHDESEWKKDHLNQLAIHYAKAPFRDEMLELARDILMNAGERLCDVTISAIEKISAYYQLDKGVTFYRSSELNVPGESTQRLYRISRELGAEIYLTGMGALRYMDFDVFENGGIAVEFIEYAKTPYPQLHGAFNPFVSILDLIANTGKDGIRYMNSKTLHYAEFINSDMAREYLLKTK
jgi:hypothetical protein